MKSAKEAETETVMALVSKAQDLKENMLVRSACIGGIVLPTAFDSCATNCFVSESVSEELRNIGHIPMRSPVAYDVRQGNPLCVTNMVHMVPVTVISTQGLPIHWYMCMFIVANTGAEAIIGYPTLAAGRIITYDPPEGYEQTLCLLAVDSSPVNADYKAKATEQVRDSRHYSYGPPLELAACFHTKKVMQQPDKLETTDRGRRYNRREHPSFTDNEVWVRGNEIELVVNELGETGEDRTTTNAEQATEVSHHSSQEGQVDQPPQQQLPLKPPLRSSEASPRLKHDTELQHQPPASIVVVAKTQTLAKQVGCIASDTSTQIIQAAESRVEPQTTIQQTNELTAITIETTTLRKKKGATEALTPALPFGQNTVLPEEVIEALLTLKQLSEKPPETLWTKEQLNEIQAKLSVNRPEWSNCLTMTHILAQFDTETAKEIEKLMDSERFQNSTFCKSLKLPAKVKYFDINQKPGVDWWNPPKVRRYKNPLMYEVVDKMLDWQITDGLLSESNAARPAVVTVVEKEGRDHRCCFDYRQRNERTEVPVFPMPDIQEFLDEAMGYEYYCSFDMAKMFNQIEINPKHRELAAFITHRGVYDPHRIQFGLQGGPQHAVREVGGLMLTNPLTNGKSFTAWAIKQNSSGRNSQGFQHKAVHRRRFHQIERKRRFDKNCRTFL